jgi:ABC-type polysaccharide/polyol phosphate export permease
MSTLLQQTDGPKIACQDEHRALSRAALRDLVEGLGRWEIWTRLSWNEVKRRYRRTLLGPMWVSVSLGIFALVLSVIWAALWRQNVREYLPFLLSGLIPWTMIAGSLGEACGAFISSEAIMKSRQFPYTTLIHVVVARNAIVFGHNLVVYVIAAFVCGVAFTPYTLLLLPGFALVILNLAWICLLAAVLCLRYRDVQQLITTLIQIAMFITPVFWPASQLTGRLSIVVDLNLLYHLIDVVRSPLLGKTPAASSYAACVLFAVAGWLGSYLLFSRKRHRLTYWF